jgi:hypothetical protein
LAEVASDFVAESPGWRHSPMTPASVFNALRNPLNQAARHCRALALDTLITAFRSIVHNFLPNFGVSQAKKDLLIRSTISVFGMQRFPRQS